jgi:hypothetical protein
MPLTDGYGVLIGTIQDYFRDDPDNYGKYYHGHLRVSAPAGIYSCAIDVDSKQSAVGVEWRTVGLKESELSNLLALGLGYHPLASNETSGAIDYIRSPMFAIRRGCLAIIMSILSRKKFNVADMWKRGEGIDALQDLEPLVQTTRDHGLKVLVFGEPFTYGGLGLHNIHQNQGDPISSQWAGENGIWQDGCTIFEQPDNTYVAFLNKFSSQSYYTDDQGHPIP